MQSTYQKRCFWICLFILGIAWTAPVCGQTEASFDNESKETIISGVLKKNLFIVPQLNKLNFGFGRYKGIEYFYEKTISKIFFQDKKIDAGIRDVIIEGSDITLALSHPVLGTGTLKFIFSDDLLKQTNAEDIQKILLETLADENHQYVFIDPQSNLYHLWSCNHTPDSHLSVRLKREEAEAQGYRACEFCFKKVLYIPELSVERALEREWAKRLCDYRPIENGLEKQALLTAAGEKVLQNWPLKRMGYDYVFYLSDSRRIEAFAIPTGKIIITTALFDSLADEDELEALLVYAVAHIEQRHSLKEYYTCLEDEGYAEAMKKLAAVAGALAGPASGIVSGALDAALPESSCNPQPLGGYQYDYIKEADSMAAFYFDVNEKPRRALVSLIKKLQFRKLSEKLHPDLRLITADNVLDIDRLKRVEKMQFVYFKKDKNFILRREGKPPVQLDFINQRRFKKENKLRVYVDDKTLLPMRQDLHDEIIISISVKDKNGKHRFRLNPEFITEDVWGAYLTFKASGAQNHQFLEDIENIVLSMAPAKEPLVRETSDPSAKSIKDLNDSLNDQTRQSYTFVPGKIDW